ncbi:MAG: Uroporphyrinogen deCOase protein [Candidatus Poribacteria bacterium]|nr:Uroporphyrinogen deCOase protein [Candidatus Poribacteria bacterium]
MERNISSRERTLAAINHTEADRIPIFFRGIAPLSHLWKNAYERVNVLLEMGVDEKIDIGIGPRFHQDVTVWDWFDSESDTDYRLACREYSTPKGTMRAIMRCTEDYREDYRYDNGKKTGKTSCPR